MPKPPQFKFVVTCKDYTIGKLYNFTFYGTHYKCLRGCLHFYFEETQKGSVNTSVWESVRVEPDDRPDHKMEETEDAR